jgi:hypothetical protein
MVRPAVGSVSQTERLVAAMNARAISHGQTVRADIEHVEVSAKMRAEHLVHFCGLRGVKVHETIAAGDGGPLPAEVVVNGLEVEREGVYDIQNALVSSNGKIDITIDNQSKVTPSRGIFSKLAMHL